ncbi:enoyl-CoA hydratase/isomerase family protein [Cumulibacter manganitolerans]|uniref:enoyl-CoA hydratase/isomerase family protein n=1 Tax=Cumulibacter manganitolerans TaxID=1884992 RepID=UPI001297966F|nr:enoyl-CoA hydratase-related protein [Cumulibacter manganitolerans]
MSIQTETDGAVRIITLDNARRANSLTWQMLDELVDALEQAGADEGVRGVLLRASHDAGFSAGMDTSLFETDDPNRAYDIITRLGDVCQAVKDCPVPVAVAMRRYVVGGALEIAAAAEFRVAAPGTFFQMPEVRIDIPSVLETVNLHRLMGWTLATELVLTADKYDAELMLQRGYLNRIEEDPEAACTALLASTAESSRHVIAQQKRLNNRWRNLHEREAIDDTRNEFALAFTRRQA